MDDHLAPMRLEILREDHAALQQKTKELMEKYSDMASKHEELTKQANALGEENAKLQELVMTKKEHQDPSENNAGQSNGDKTTIENHQNNSIHTVNEKLRKEKETLEKKVIHLRNDLERVYKRFKDQKATPNDHWTEVSRLLDHQSTWETQQMVVQDLIHQCKTKLETQHVQKRRRLDEEFNVHEEMLKEVIEHFKAEVKDRQEFHQAEAQLSLECTESTQVQELRKEKVTLELELKLSKDACAALEMEKKSGHAYVISLQEELNREKAAVENSKAEIQARIQDLEAQVSERDATIQNLHGEISNEPSRTEELMKAVREYEIQIEQLKERIAAKEQYLLAQKEDTLAVLKKQADERLEREASETEYQMKIQLLEEKISSLHGELTDRDTMLSDVKLKMLELAKEIVAKDNEAIEMKKKMEETIVSLEQRQQTQAKESDEKLLYNQLQLEDTEKELKATQNQLEKTTSELQLKQERDGNGQVDASQELHEFFLAYYASAETKLRNALSTNQDKTKHLQRLEELVTTKLLPLVELDDEIRQAITATFQAIDS